MAQRLYEAGYITYMRTDSTNLSQEALDSARAYISDNFGDKYLPDSPNRYGSKEGAQEAHEAIRPSNVSISAASLGDMERDAQRLYELIWRQFVACQMTPAKYDATTIKVAAGDYELTAKGRVLKFDGWTRVQPQLRKKGEEELMLPDVQKGDVLDLKALDPKQHFTKPVARFNEASLVKELEKRGIGRPSTYASIISTIQDRGYVRLENKRFYAEKMGEIVNDRLMENFDDLMSYDFTANMEQHLDDIAEAVRLVRLDVDVEPLVVLTPGVPAARHAIPRHGGRLRLPRNIRVAIRVHDIGPEIPVEVFLGHQVRPPRCDAAGAVVVCAVAPGPAWVRVGLHARIARCRAIYRHLGLRGDPAIEGAGLVGGPLAVRAFLDLDHGAAMGGHFDGDHLGGHVRETLLVLAPDIGEHDLFVGVFVVDAEHAARIAELLCEIDRFATHLTPKTTPVAQAGEI